MKTVVMNVINAYQHGNLFKEVLKLRYKMFVEKEGWPMPNLDGCEFDQYDTGYAWHFATVNDNGKLCASARIGPTNKRVGNNSYMIKDAISGLLDGIPSNILTEAPPQSDKVYEATRFTLNPDCEQEELKSAQHNLLQSMCEYGQRNGIEEYIGLMPRTYYRSFRNMGFEIVEIGPRLIIDGRSAAVAVMPSHSNAMALAS